jgi:Fe-S cluster biogenesis protein NfuA/nitrite reductase/ring-hydroxylating ferredoxin subunit
MPTDALPGELVDRVQQLSAEIDQLSDVRARELAKELVAAVIAMYGDGLERIIQVISECREAGATILDQLSQDGAVASLLLIHDLYPVPLEQRVIEALDTVRPYMESHGGNVELVGIERGVAKLVLEGSCNGCAASRATLELAIKQALDEHAPDLAGLEVAGLTEEPLFENRAMGLPMAGPELPLVHSGPELPLVHSGPELPLAAEPPPAHWVPLQESGRPAPGALWALDVGVELVLADVDGRLLAYIDECASCGGSISGGELHAGMLRCRACDAEFDLPRAGRAAGGEPLQLRPVPLLESGGVRVAIPV